MKYTIATITENADGFIIATLANVTGHNGGTITNDPFADNYFDGLSDLKVGDEIIIID